MYPCFNLAIHTVVPKNHFQKNIIDIPWLTNIFNLLCIETGKPNKIFEELSTDVCLSSFMISSETDMAKGGLMG